MLKRVLSPREIAVAKPVQLGESGAAVFALPQPGDFVKIAPIDAAGAAFSLRREADVLKHLAGIAPVPRMLAYVEAEGHAILRMSGIAGLDASSARLHAQPERLAFALAHALRRLHALSVAAHARFDRRLAVTVAEAETRASAGVVDLDDLDDGREASTLDALVVQLRATRPRAEDLVPTHGDYCLPNVLFDPDTYALTGFVDLGRFGIADRHQDLALGVRSLSRNLPRGDYSEPFLRAYAEGLDGFTVDREKLAFYQLLDEFF
jgi:kanamycin kinase/aminoglycoside 3'-phosphotransferase-2